MKAFTINKSNNDVTVISSNNYESTIIRRRHDLVYTLLRNPNSDIYLKNLRDVEVRGAEDKQVLEYNKDDDTWYARDISIEGAPIIPDVDGGEY